MHKTAVFQLHILVSPEQICNTRSATPAFNGLPPVKVAIHPENWNTGRGLQNSGSYVEEFATRTHFKILYESLLHTQKTNTTHSFSNTVYNQHLNLDTTNTMIYSNYDIRALHIKATIIVFHVLSSLPVSISYRSRCKIP